jgi:tRNA(Ile)-lysidine synthase
MKRDETPALSLHVLHVNHQARGLESDADAQFVRELAGRLGLPFHLGLRDQLEMCCRDLPENLPARFRAIRFAFFRQIVDAAKLDGVILAHHADDQAETVMHRLLRGSGFAGLGGMSSDGRVAGVRVLRPLLRVRGEALRAYLRSIDQPWREDASNTSPRYARNRIRAALRDRDQLIEALCQLGESCRTLREWVDSVAPALPEVFATKQLADLPRLLAEAAARGWLKRRGVPGDELVPSVLERLISMTTDAATGSVQQFARGVRVRRKGGVVFGD